MSRPPRLLLVAAGVAGVAVTTTAFPGAWPRGIVLQGGVFGVAAGLLAVGLVLTYRTTKIINFAYGAMGSAAAEVGVVAYQRLGVPWGICVLLAAAAGALVGLGVDVLMRRFANAPRLVVTVATIGLLQILVGLQFGVAFWTGANPLVPPFSTGLARWHASVGAIIFTGNDVLALLLAPVAVFVLSWFLLRTDAGTAVRAIADNADRAKLLGIPLRRLSRVVWVLVGVLGAAVMILNAPTDGLPITPFVSAGGIFMLALAAAVIAQMDSLPTAFAVGTALGVLDAVVSFNVHKSSLVTVALLVAILGALLAQHQHRPRADAEESSWALAGVSRALPADVARLPELLIGRTALLTALGVSAIVLPLVAPPSQVHTVAGYEVLGIGVLSLVVLSGWSGTISLGQFAIVGVGGVVAGDLIVKANLDLFLALVLAAIAAAAVSVLIGLPALRVRPIFLAVTTLAFGAAMDQFFLNPTNFPHWIPGSIIRPVLWKRFPLQSENATYYVCLGVLVAVILVVRALQRTRPARILHAVRDNPEASAALAVPVVRSQVVGMVAAGLIAGIAGGLWATLQNGVGASSFQPQDSILLFSMAVVGGLGSISGSLSGLAVTELLILGIGRLSPAGAQFASLGTGALLLAVLVVLPGGIVQFVERVRDAIAVRVAARHGIALAVGGASGSVAEPHTPGARAETSVDEMRARPLLWCRNLTASYGPLQVLFGVDLDVFAGEMVALLGTNGAGKSTIFRAVSGLLESSGDVTFDGHSIAGEPADVVARAGLAMMPGGRGMFPHLTVSENLRLACWQLRADRVTARAAEEHLQNMFPALRNRLDHPAGTLSGGEQQQLSLAMAFATRPKVLLIDELSLGLAPAVVTQLCEKVRAIHASGTTVVVVEQSVSVALELAARAIFLEKGAVRFEGPTAELLARPDLLRSVFIGQAAARTDGGPASSAGDSGTPPPARRVELVCQGVSKRFGAINALDGVDLHIAPGSITGLIGHNGAGKTTLFDVISGFQRADKGRVLLGPTDMTALPPHRRAVEGLGRSFQQARLFPSLTVTQTIMVALDRRLACRDWFAAALGGPPSVDAERSALERSAEITDLLGLDGYADVLVADLSTGTRRIVELACVLAAEPVVTLLDEPSAGLAQKETEALGPLLRRVHERTRSSILIIEHDIPLLTSICDELVALDQGAVICSGPPRQVLAHPRVIESYVGTARRSGHRTSTTHERGDAGARSNGGRSRDRAAPAPKPLETG